MGYPYNIHVRVKGLRNLRDFYNSDTKNQGLDVHLPIYEVREIFMFLQFNFKQRGFVLNFKNYQVISFLILYFRLIHKTDRHSLSI